MAQVLVLNQDYQAISLCAPERAIVLVLMKKAELVSDVETRKMRSVKREFKYPSVIRLHKYVYLPFKKVSLTRDNVFKRDGYECVYCGTDKNLTLDHLVPRALGGRTIWNNLVTACYTCNSEKGDRPLETSGLVLNSKPYRPSFIMFLSQFAGNINDDWKPYLFIN